MEKEMFDVVVVGAGASGVPAAVAAARAGVRVALVEKDSAPGGAMRDGLGFPICGLFRTDADEPLLINDGLVGELLEKMSAFDENVVEQRGRVHLLRSGTGQFEKIYRDWIDAEANIRLFTQASGLQVKEHRERISMLEFNSAENKTIRMQPGAIIDCSGDAEIVRNCSARTIEPLEPALAGFLLWIRNVELNDMLPIKVPHVLWNAAEEGRLPSIARYTVFDSGLLKISITPGINANEFAADIFSILQSSLPEFHDSEIAETSGRVLQREGIRLKGEVVLSEEDVRSGRKYSDAAARGSWPMEFWGAESGVLYSYVEGDATYDIPLRALKSENVSNLWAAGRMISSDSMALSSVRVVGTCIATGEAAGRAAAREAV